MDGRTHQHSRAVPLSTRAEIDEHLAQFDDGAVRFADVESMNKYGTAGPPGGVMPKSEFEQMLSDSGGNLSIMEEKLGFDPGHLTGGKYQPVLIDAEDFNGIRIPSGNEGGVNDFWLLGGYTSGGMPEAVMDFDGVDFPRIGFKPPASRRSASAYLSLILLPGI